MAFGGQQGRTRGNDGESGNQACGDAYCTSPAQAAEGGVESECEGTETGQGGEAAEENGFEDILECECGV